MLTAAMTRARRALSSSTAAPLVGAVLVALLPAAAGAGSGDSPKPPANVTLSAASANTLSISWEAPRARGGRQITGYELFLDGASAGATTGLSHQFVSLDCARVYTLGVEAIDNTGAHSSRATISSSTAACDEAASVQPASNTIETASATTAVSATPQTLSFAVAADARVVEASPTSNYGTSSYIRVDAGSDPDVESYLRFDVSGAAQVQSAKLRLYATSSGGVRPAVYATSNNWLERGITWSNRPARTGSASDETGTVASSSWIEWDVSEHVTGNGAVSFAVVGLSTDGITMSSREGVNAPQLVLVTSGTASSDTTPPGAPASVTALAATATSASLAWTASTDDVGVTGYDVYQGAQKIATTSGTTYSVDRLACGTTYVFGVAAFDAAGNVSPRTEKALAMAPCVTLPPSDVTCHKVAATTGSDSAAGTVAAPFRTPQKLADTLASGETGCLRGGRYTSSSLILNVSRNGITIRSYPGERATLEGIVQIRDAVTKTTLSNLSFEGIGGANTLKVYGDDTVIEDSKLTNFGRGDSCLMLGSTSGGIAHRPIVRRNRFHDCGDPYDQYGHGIYASQVTDGKITNNVFWNSYGYAIQLYPNSQRTIFANNVIDGGGVSFRGGVTYGGDGVTASNDNVIEYNVITYAATQGVKAQRIPGSGNVARRNCFWKNTLGDLSSGVTAYENIQADPLFVDRSGRDYRLSDTSACRALISFDSTSTLIP